MLKRYENQKEIPKKIYLMIGVMLIAVGFGFLSLHMFSNLQASDGDVIDSPYAGQEGAEIKSLSQDDVEGLLAGSGTPFGGMAKPAELNGYPGPRHVLDAYDAGEFELTDEQHEQIKALYEEMRSQAVELGEEIIDAEKDIDDTFADQEMTEELLQEKISESTESYSQLRALHLKYHLSTVEILTSHQVQQYNELRGYNTSEDPCENVPEGHDPDLWKQHNNC